MQGSEPCAVGSIPAPATIRLYERRRIFQEAISSTILSGVVTASSLSGVLDEIVGLLPVVIPVMIGFIALRKGISFLISTLRAA